MNLDELFYNGRYTEVLRVTALADKHGHELFFSARALFALKRYPEARAEFILLAQEQHAAYSSISEMWLILIGLFLDSSPDTEDRRARVIGISQKGDEQVAAFSLVIQANIMSVAIGAGFRSPTNYRQVASLCLEAEQKFKATGDLGEAALAAYDAIYYQARNPLLSRVLLTKRIKKALHEKNWEQTPVLPIRLKSMLLKYEFLASFELQRPIEVPNILHQIDQLAIRAEAVLYSAGLDVRYTLGALLLDHGYEEGLSVVKHTALLYTEITLFTEAQAAWTTCAQWYRFHGRFRDMERCDAEAAVAGSLVENPLLIAAELPKKLVSYLMAGNVAELIKISTEFLESFPDQLLAPQIRALRAQGYISSHDFHNAEKDLKKIQKVYGQARTSSFLADIQLRLGLFYAVADLDKGLRYVLTAIKTAERIGARELTSQLWSHLGHLLNYKTNTSFLYRHKIYKAPDVFHTAAAILATLPQLTAKIELGKTYQYIGVYYIQRRDPVNASVFLDKARAVFIANELSNELAFMNSHLGNLYLQAASDRSSAEDFSFADHYLTEAAKYFSSSGMSEGFILATGSLARSKMHQAAIALTAAGQNALIHETEEYLRQGCARIDRLRILSGFGPNLKTVVASAYFGAKYQNIYQLGFILHTKLSKDHAAALQWLERMKSQSLLAHIIGASAIKGGTVKYLDELKLLAVKKMQLPPGKKRDQLDREMDKLQSLTYAPTSVENERAPQERSITNLLTVGTSSLHTVGLTVSYYYNGRELYIFGLKPDTQQPEVLNYPFDVSTVTEALIAFLSQNRNTPTHELKKTEGFEGFSFLIEPIEKWSSPGEPVCIIPFGELHHFPFHALPTAQGQFLIERNPVSYAPSLQSLQAIQSRKRRSVRQPLIKIFGNPTSDLPDAEKEAITISGFYQVAPLLRSSVNKKIFISAFNDADILHYSGHGETDLKDGLQQSLLLSKKQRITAADLLQNTSELRLLTLSGCSTGLSQLISSGDETLGLVYAAFIAGAEAVVASQWKVADDRSKELMVAFYIELNQGHSVAHSLQTAIKQMIDAGVQLRDWAAFSAFGNGTINFDRS